MRPIDRTVWYVESHLNRAVSLDDTAKIAGLSKFALARAFLAATGHTVLAYARARRLSEAAKSLQKGAPSILDVALFVGYASHEAFSRAFRGHFGLTPVEARYGRRPLSLTEAIDMSNDPTPPHCPHASKIAKPSRSLDSIAASRYRTRRGFQPYGKASAGISAPSPARFLARRMAYATIKTATPSTISAALRCGQGPMRLKSLSRSKCRPTATRSFIMAVMSPTSTRS